jgi:hypothetical protein
MTNDCVFFFLLSLFFPHSFSFPFLFSFLSSFPLSTLFFLFYHNIHLYMLHFIKFSYDKKTKLYWHASYNEIDVQKSAYYKNISTII